jgi:hypothetical protein
MVYQLEKQIKELGDKAPADVKDQLQTRIDALKKEIEADNTEGMKAKMQELEELAMKLGEAVYAQQQAQGAPPQGGDPAAQGGGGMPPAGGAMPAGGGAPIQGAPGGDPMTMIQNMKSMTAPTAASPDQLNADADQIANILLHTPIGAPRNQILSMVKAGNKTLYDIAKSRLEQLENQSKQQGVEMARQGQI